MTFSELYNVSREPSDGWFDPILTLDTRLFVDPFLIYANEEGVFEGSHDEIIDVFNAAFKLIARSGGVPRSLYWRKAESLLYFPEVEEICLGYASQGTKGAGSGSGFARIISRALWEAVNRGLKKITHFEEVGILQKGIGADRISDATTYILRSRLAAYTLHICKKHNIPTATFRYRRGIFNLEEERWDPISVQLPLNPFNEKAVLLVPRNYLNNLPTINADDFWDYCYTNHNETLRTEFNYDVSRHVSKKVIIDIARKHPELRKSYLKAREETLPNRMIWIKTHKDFTGGIKLRGTMLQIILYSFKSSHRTISKMPSKT